jgi:molybdopterin-containing oxidoreductase family membrane subunit
MSAWTTDALTDPAQVSAIVADPVLVRRRGAAWWWVLFGSLALTAVLVGAVTYSFLTGVGAWGNNTSVVWGFPIASYVWWIALGSGGTLISSLLTVTRQAWRASINRFAEAMAIFAICIAGFYPILHLGRPMYFYWLAPYPNPLTLWPQWRSALVWDFFAIASYLLFSILFFYLGLIPDLATLRDRARHRLTAQIYGAFALGWRGGRRQWAALRALHRMMAITAIPLICSVHSVVGLDFAASLAPGWEEGMYPPWFVAGAVFSGFAIIVVITFCLRGALKLQAMITPAHFEVMGAVVLASCWIMTLCYAVEWFTGWYRQAPAELRRQHFEIFGPYGWLYVLLVLMNVLVPQALWSPRARRSPLVVTLVSLSIIVGMWIERMLIILDTLSHDYLPSSWRIFVPTAVDFLIMVGAFGFFTLLMLLFARVTPAASMHDTRALLAGAEAS